MPTMSKQMWTCVIVGGRGAADMPRCATIPELRYVYHDKMAMLNADDAEALARAANSNADLLEALKVLMDAIPKPLDSRPNETDAMVTKRLVAAYMTALEAIAKAEGK